jgi:hypothetical protein
MTRSNGREVEQSVTVSYDRGESAVNHEKGDSLNHWKNHWKVHTRFDVFGGEAGEGR